MFDLKIKIKDSAIIISMMENSQENYLLPAFRLALFQRIYHHTIYTHSFT